MSRIFDALQRSGAEQSGVTYSDVLSVVTEVFEVPEATSLREERPIKVSAIETVSVDVPRSKELAREPKSQTLSEFPSLDVRLAPSNGSIFIPEPESLAAEKFRFLGVRLRQLQKIRPVKKVLITSTIPQEGKSLVSANLARVLAGRKQKVLLIDGDLRRPVLAQRFGLAELNGVAEWLRGDGRKLEGIYHLEGLDFWLMPAGDPPVNPLELLAPGPLSHLMEQTCELFDWIIVDSPPVLPLADTTVWARVVDGILLVARVGTTEKAQLVRGLETIKKSELLGVVLNSCADLDHESYYQRYSSGAKEERAPGIERV